MDVLNKIKNQLKKRKEKIIFDLYVKDYDHSNFYFALVFNEKVEKFKVLYVPLDLIETRDNVEDYFCYQFVLMSNVNYLLETVHVGQDKLKDMNKCQRHYPNIDSYYLEMNTHVGGKDCTYSFTQYISKDFPYLFDVVVLLFEYSPNIVSELCNKLLLEFVSIENAVVYQGSYSKKMEHFEDLFSKEILEESYNYDNLSYLENVGKRYFAVVKGEVLILDVFDNLSLINIHSGKYDVLGKEVYLVLKAIRDSIQKEFLRVEVEGEYYLCYGVKNGKLQTVRARDEYSIPISMISNKKVKFLSEDKRIIEEVKKVLEEKYEDYKVEEFMEYLTS